MHKKKVILKSAGVLLASFAILLSGCSKDPKVQGAKYLEQGKKHFEEKDYGSALLDFKNAQRFLKKDAEPAYQLGLTYLAMGDGKAAAANLMDATGIDPKHVGAQLKIAELMAVNHDPKVVEQGVERAKTVLEMAPDNLDALQALAVADLRLDKSEDASRLLEQTLAKFPGNLKSSVTLAMVRIREGKTAVAEDILKQAVAQAPQSTEAALAMGQFYIMTGKAPEAEQWLRKAIELDPKQTVAMLDLGQLLMRTGRADAAEPVYRQASNLQQKELRPIHAMYLFNMGKRDAAITELESLVKQDSKDRGTRNQLITAYFASGRFTDAEKVLSGVLKQNPKDNDALIQRGQVYLAIKMVPEAEKDLTTLVQSEPTSGSAHFALSKVYAAEGQQLKQQSELNQALSRNSGLLPARVQLAQLLTARKDTFGALALMDSAPDEQKASVEAIAERNAILLAMQKWDEAKKGIDQGLKTARTPPLLLEEGLWKLQRKDFAGARTSLEEVLKQSPENLDALRAIMLSYSVQKQPNSGVQRIRQQTLALPKSAPLRSYLAQVLIERGMLEEARTELLGAEAADPTHMLTQILLAQMDQQKNPDAARQRLNALLARNPESKEVRLVLADLEMGAKNYSAAIDQYRKVIDMDQNNIMALNNLAYLLANNANQPDEALKLAQQVKSLAPENPTIEDTIGWAYYQKGLFKSAVQHLESANAATGGTVIRYHLAMAYFKVGDRQRGGQILASAMKTDSALPEAKMALDVQRSSLQ